jgi:hypothetical protein
MTPEQQREQWLKRLLPALAILVIYFSIVSNFITSKTKKAREDYQTLIDKGIDEAMLPIKQQEMAVIREELSKLEADEKRIRDELSGVSGFLSGKGTQNDTLDKLSVIFKNNSLQVLEEKRSDKVDLSTLSKSFVELQKNLTVLAPTPVATPTPAPAPVQETPTAPATATVNLQTIHYYGSYRDNYHALNELLTSQIKILPVSLTMQAPKTNNGSPVAGQLEWNLMLWL